MMRLSLRKITAAMLPLSYLWLFAACVSMCAGETARAGERTFVYSAAASAEVGCERGREGCPVVAQPAATTPARDAFKFNGRTPSAVPVSGPAFHLPNHAARRPSHRIPPSVSPPLERLPSLRI